MPESMEATPKLVLKLECFDSEGNLKWVEEVEMKEETTDGWNNNDRRQERHSQ